MLTPPGASTNGEAINVDGDRAAAMVAGAFTAEALVILTDTPGLLRTFPDESTLITRIAKHEADRFMSFAEGRMKKKVMGAVEAIGEGVGTVIFADGRSRRRFRAHSAAPARTSPRVDSMGDPRAAIEERILGGTTARRGDTVFVRGEGCWLVASDGRRYLDLAAAQGVAMLGHCHPRVSEAIARQAQTLTLCPNYLYNDVRAAFAEALAAVLPPHLPHAFLANSGGEAVDGALKFARLVTRRPTFVSTAQGFHGRTMGALSVTWEPKYRDGFLPLLDAQHVPFNNIAALDRAIGDTTAAFVVEPVQGESGVNIGSPEFLQAAQRFCRDRGALLILDEIQTGFGRTGRWFGFEHAGIEPDIVCHGQRPRRRISHGRAGLHSGGSRRALSRGAWEHVRRVAARMRGGSCGAVRLSG